MRIAVIHNLPPGGQKRALFEQIKLLSKNHALDLFTLSSTDESFLPLKPFIQKHIRVTYNPPPHFPQSVFSIYYDLPIVYKLLAEKINERNYDTAYVNPCYLTQAPYILRYLKIPSLYYCPEPKREFYESIPHVSNQLTYFLTYPFRLPIKSIDKTNTRRATRILTNSRYSQERIKKIYGVSSYVYVNYLGIDTRVFKPSSDSSISAREHPRGVPQAQHNPWGGGIAEVSLTSIVLTVGEVSLHKGHDFIINAVSLIPQKNRPKLVIVGHGGTEKQYLLDLAKKVRVEISLIENISDSKLIEWYNKARVFLYAPLNEPFGMALLEALSCGLPIVAVNEGGIPEIITNNKLGLLVERDEKKFAAAIEKIFARNDIKASGEIRNYISKHWNWEKSVKELERHLKELAK